MYRTALITGASSGIGRGLARWFASRGVTVYATARRLSLLEELAREQPDTSARIHPVRMDVSDGRATREQIRAIDAECGGLDLVIANAAVAPETPADSASWDAIEQIIDTNVRGAAATLSAIADRMAERKAGHLVGISSLAAARGAPRNAAYSASKAFLSNYLEGLRIDLTPHGVHVTTISPGFVKTPGTEQNSFEMPFLLEADDAVERIGRALLRKDSELAFPWQSALVTRLGRWLPNAWWDRAARGFHARRP